MIKSLLWTKNCQPLHQTYRHIKTIECSVYRYARAGFRYTGDLDHPQSPDIQFSCLDYYRNVFFNVGLGYRNIYWSVLRELRMRTSWWRENRISRVCWLTKDPKLRNTINSRDRSANSICKWYLKQSNIICRPTQGRIIKPAIIVPCRHKRKNRSLDDHIVYNRLTLSFTNYGVSIESGE